MGAALLIEKVLGFGCEVNIDFAPLKLRKAVYRDSESDKSIKNSGVARCTQVVHVCNPDEQ